MINYFSYNAKMLLERFEVLAAVYMNTHVFRDV